MKRGLMVLALALAAPAGGATQDYCIPAKNAVLLSDTAASSVPATAQFLRRTVTICVSLENAGGALVKCRDDGVAPVWGVTEPGEVLAVGDCVTYRQAWSTAVQCITDTDGTGVSVAECKTP